MTKWESCRDLGSPVTAPCSASTLCCTVFPLNKELTKRWVIHKRKKKSYSKWAYVYPCFSGGEDWGELVHPRTNSLSTPWLGFEPRKSHWGDHDLLKRWASRWLSFINIIPHNPMNSRAFGCAACLGPPKWWVSAQFATGPVSADLHGPKTVNKHSTPSTPHTPECGEVMVFPEIETNSPTLLWTKGGEPTVILGNSCHSLENLVFCQ